MNQPVQERDVKIVGFLQNEWFRDPVRVSRMPNRRGVWLRALAMSVTGRRLTAALGSDVYDTIHWANASPVIGKKSSSKYIPYVPYMQLIIDEAEPTLIVAFGAVAREGLQACRTDASRLYVPHPAARGLDVRAVFVRACAVIRYKYEAGA